MFECRRAYNLTFDDIADLLNRLTNQDKGESSYRKEFAAFNRGRQYEINKQNNGIVTRILDISDLHIPFHLPVTTYSDYVGIVDMLVINGDVMDCQSISRFPKLYRSSIIEEMLICRKYLIDVINYIHPKKVMINKGNHDERLQKYLVKNLDSDIIELMPETPLDMIIDDGFHHYNKKDGTKTFYEPIKNFFEDIEVIYTGDWKCKIGKTWFCHPNTSNSQTLKTCEKAVEYFHKTDKEKFDAVVISHTHRTADSKQGYISLFEQGACCYTEKMTYTDGTLSSPQKEGFLYICQDKEGNLVEDKTKLVRLN